VRAYRAFGVVLFLSCAKLEFDDTPVVLSLMASAERTVTNENPRVYACNVTLQLTSGPADRENFVELLTLRRTIEIEGQESTSTDPAATKLGTRRLYAREQASGTDSFSATFPFKASFRYTLVYRDATMRIDSTRTTTTCG
jgi:hypothetical protein